MATRTAKLYQGEDLSPVLDYTDLMIWEESEFGTRAWQGEGNASSVVIRDPLGEQGNEASLPAGLTAKSLASKNLFIIQLGTDFMFRGRVGIKNYSRDSQHVERYRQVECSLHDTNWDLDHIFVHDYVRPAETDIARAQGVIASYLSGYPRESTILNGSNFLSGSNTVNLPANTYTRTSPLGILREVAVTANKQFFVIGDTITGGSLFWDGNDSSVYPAGIRVSDRIDEIDTTLPCSTSSTASVISSGYIVEGSGAGSLIVPAGLTNSMLVAIGVTSDLFTPWSATWTVGGTPHAMTAVPGGAIGHSLDDALGKSSRIQAFYLLNPAAAPNPNDGFLQIIQDGIGGGALKGYFLIENVNQSDPFASVVTAEGTDSSAEITIPESGGALYLNGYGNNEVGTGTAPTVVAGQTQAWSFGTVTIETAGGYGDPTPAWTLAGARLWVMVGMAVNGSGLGSDFDGPTFPPIWNAGPASTEDGSEQLCEVKLFYGTGTNSYVTTHDPVVHNLYGHSSDTFTDDTIANAAEAQTKSNSILAHRKYEDKTYNVTIGPLTDEQVLCVKHGQTIQIKARAIPDADDAFRTMRIVQCRYTTPIVGIWFAHLQLGRPWKMQPYSKGPPLTPNAAGSGDTPETLGLDGDAGTDTGTFANSDHTHGHGTFGTNDLHTEYVREPILTTAGDMPYASGASVWTRLPIGSSNYHMVSDGAVPLWLPQTGGGGGSSLTVEDEGTPLATSADTLDFVGAGVVASGTGTTKTITISGGGGGDAQIMRFDPGSAPGSPSADDDEFEDASISGSLTRVAHGTPKGSWAEQYGRLSWMETASMAAGEMDVYANARSVSVGDYVEVSVNRAVAHGNCGVAVGFSDGTTYGTSNAIASFTKFESAISYFLLNRWPGHNTRTNDGTALGMTQYQFISHFYLRVKYEAADTWGLYLSLNGHQWHTIQTNFSYTMTPTHIIFGVGADTSNAPAWIMFDYVRVNAA